MDIQNVHKPANFGQQVQDAKAEHTKADDGPFGKTVSALAHNKDIDEPTSLTAKQQLNAAILESAVKVNISAGNESLSLVLKTALEGINEALGSDTAIQDTYDSGLDVSPEATADRIVSLSTAFFDAFQRQHTELNHEEALTAFIEVIGGGINQGFAEAREILDGLQVLKGSIASNIDKTYDLVQEKLDAFVASFEVEE